MSERFSKGDRVVYVPTHAAGDATHPDCEHGVVRCYSPGGAVFVVYDNAVMRMVTGDEPYTAQLTLERDLVKEQANG